MVQSCASPMKHLKRSAVRHQHCCLSSSGVSFSVKNYRSIRNNRAMRPFAGGLQSWERGCVSNSLPGKSCFVGKDRKVLTINCCSLPDDDMDNSLVTEPNKTDSNSVLDDAAFLLKLVGVSFAGGLQCCGCSLTKTIFRLRKS
jgi:hypothetical protein